MTAQGCHDQRAVTLSSRPEKPRNTKNPKNPKKNYFDVFRQCFKAREELDEDVPARIIAGDTSRYVFIPARIIAGEAISLVCICFGKKLKLSSIRR